MSHPGLGRVPHYDPKNENYPLEVSRVRAAIFSVTRALALSRTRSWRQWLTFDQGATPECTAFGSATFLAADPIHQQLDWLRRLDVHAWYRDNVAEDRANGRIFTEGGATTLAAMEVGKRRGYWSEYRWAQTFEDMRTWIHNTAPLIAGTYWYPSMWERDAEGIVSVPRPGESPVGGHLYCVNGYNPKRDMFRSNSTWGDGVYLIPGDLMRRLFEEEGEAVFPTELKVTP